MDSKPKLQNTVGTLPPTPEIRHRLADVMREAEVLRKLLKIAEFSEKQPRIKSENNKENHNG